jgi:hypothetical protein
MNVFPLIYACLFDYLFVLFRWVGCFGVPGGILVRGRILKISKIEVKQEIPDFVEIHRFRFVRSHKEKPNVCLAPFFGSNAVA